jgi:hypothetical protein
MLPFFPPYEVGGKPNVREAGGCFGRSKDPPVSLRELSPLFHKGDTPGFNPKPLAPRYTKSDTAQ